MKRFAFPFILLSFLLSGCNNSPSQEDDLRDEFGVFLGATSQDFEKIKGYQNLCIDVDEFSTSELAYFSENKIDVYAYLSIGSLENYRSYYDTFKHLEFYEYENWPDEKWVDVSDLSWQNHITSEANRLKELGASGLFMDNFDVYYIALEEYEEATPSFKEAIYQGCKSILSNLSNIGLKLIINSGTDFLERLNEEHSDLLDKIDIYAQECVFSSIEDYDKDDFGRQNKEDHDYYVDIINMMKSHSSILLIEYTVDIDLINEIKSYCTSNNFSYYISSTVDLKA